jgi:hypothetical protein
MEKAFAATPVPSPNVKKSAFTAENSHVPPQSNSSSSQAEDDDDYYPSKVANKRSTFNSRLQDHDTPKNAKGRNVLSESESDDEAPQGSKINIDDYPILVPHPKEKKIWIQVHCPICKGNTRGDGFWFKGVMGAKRHMRLAHKEVCNNNTNTTIFGEDAVSRLIERRYTAAEFDDLKNGRIPAPIAKLGTTETVDKSFQENDEIKAYMAFDKYPTIIRRSDREWVELRCPKCNGNCINGKYMRGVDAFRQHLEHDHHKPVPGDQIPAAWVVKRCETRELTEHELLGLMDDRKDAQRPNKVNIGASFTGNDADNEESIQGESSEDNIGGIRSRKRHGPFIEDEDTEDEEDHISHAEAPRRRKRARETIASAAAIRSTMLSKDQHDAQEKKDREAMDMDVDGGDAVTEWSDCCPCTLEGHECQLHKCTKPKVCMKLDHCKGCLTGVTHAFKPLCIMFQVGGKCDASKCDFSHDKECKKFLEPHDCQKH